MDFALLLASGYLLGSLNGAQLLHHVFRVHFPRHITRIGTKNAGAQNIWMNFGKIPGITVFFVDSAKGFAAIILGKMLGFEGAMLIIVGAFVIAGHNWPVFFHFRGGRGFASLIGIFYAFNLWVAIIASIVSLPFGILRYAGVTPFVFLIVGCIAFFSTFGMPIVGAYVFMAVALYIKRLHAEWGEYRKAKRKLPVLKNLLLYDRANSNPPALHELW
jgi:acyl phosphate:glycerol-3-phosphate acyltransferase